jgi:N-acetylglutamate synthase-like GNAT family acetyltransferase
VEGFYITSQLNEQDIESVHRFISKSYWAKGIPLQTLTTAILNSCCFAVKTAEHDVIAFARLVTDYATFAYIADVYVLEPYRGKGLSKRLMSHIFRQPNIQELRRIMLVTQDAHELYKKYGFQEVQELSAVMHKWQPDIYSEKV